MAVEIEWIDSTSPQATGNKIYRDTVPSTGEVEIADIANGVNFYSDGTVAEGTEYKYEVQAHDGAGDETTQEVEGENMDYITTAGGVEVNLLVNGDFDTDLSGWTFDTNRGNATWDGGTARIDNDAPLGYPRIEQNVTVEIGKTYEMAVDVLIGTAPQVQLALLLENPEQYEDIYTDGKITITFTATVTTVTFLVYLYEGDQTTNYMNIDNCYLKEIL